MGKAGRPAASWRRLWEPEWVRVRVRVRRLRRAPEQGPVELRPGSVRAAMAAVWPSRRCWLLPRLQALE